MVRGIGYDSKVHATNAIPDTLHINNSFEDITIILVSQCHW